MAHLANSQIQAHSAGPLFPYVIARREINLKPAYWMVIAPDGTEFAPFLSYDEASSYAFCLKHGRLPSLAE